MNSCPSACVGKLIPTGAKMVASRMILRKYGIAGLVEVSHVILTLGGFPHVHADPLREG